MNYQEREPDDLMLHNLPKSRKNYLVCLTNKHITIYRIPQIFRVL